MKSGDAVKSHNRVWSQHEVFTVAALRLVVVVVGQFVVTRHFLIGEDVFRLKVVVVYFFDLFDFVGGHVENQPLLLIQLGDLRLVLELLLSPLFFLLSLELCLLIREFSDVFLLFWCFGLLCRHFLNYFAALFGL